MSTFRPHQISGGNSYGPPKHAMTRSVNYSASPHVPSHLFEAEDPLQVEILRISVIFKYLFIIIPKYQRNKYHLILRIEEIKYHKIK